MPPPTTHLTPDHDAAILRAITSTVLASRRAIYATPGLEDVAGNGGSRANQRIQQMLRKMCAAYGVVGLVEEVVAAARGGEWGEGGKYGGEGENYSGGEWGKWREWRG